MATPPCQTVPAAPSADVSLPEAGRIIAACPRTARGVYPSGLQIADCRLQIERRSRRSSKCTRVLLSSNLQSAICNLQSRRASPLPQLSPSGSQDEETLSAVHLGVVEPAAHARGEGENRGCVVWIWSIP